MTFVDRARAYARGPAAGCRPRTSGSSPRSRAGFGRRRPLVWNWTESEHSDGRTRFVHAQGRRGRRAGGLDWYFDGGAQPPEFCAKLLLPGLGLDASPSIGFRLAWDLR